MSRDSILASLGHEKVRGSTVIVWRAHGLEHAFRGDPTTDPTRWEAFLAEIETALEHHAAGAHHHNAHLTRTRHISNAARRPLDKALVQAKLIEAGGAPAEDEEP